MFLAPSRVEPNRVVHSLWREIETEREREKVKASFSQNCFSVKSSRTVNLRDPSRKVDGESAILDPQSMSNICRYLQ